MERLIYSSCPQPPLLHSPSVGAVPSHPSPSLSQQPLLSASYPSHSFWAGLAIVVAPVCTPSLPPFTLLVRKKETRANTSASGHYDRATTLYVVNTPITTVLSLRLHTRHLIAFDALDPPLLLLIHWYRHLTFTLDETQGSTTMPHSHHAHAHHHVRSDTFVGSASKASQTMADQVTRVLAARSTSTCTKDSDPGCTKPTQVPTLAVALAVM